MDAARAMAAGRLSGLARALDERASGELCRKVERSTVGDRYLLASFVLLGGSALLSGIVVTIAVSWGYLWLRYYCLCLTP